MLHEQPFLDAIAAEPSNVAARLVYADWLEDQGDPRAILIRLREELRTQSPLHARYWQARQEFCELRQTLSTDWIIAMGYDEILKYVTE